MLYKVYANNVSICKAIDENVDHIMEKIKS